MLTILGHDPAQQVAPEEQHSASSTAAPLLPSYIEILLNYDQQLPESTSRWVLVNIGSETNVTCDRLIHGKKLLLSKTDVWLPLDFHAGPNTPLPYGEFDVRDLGFKADCRYFGNAWRQRTAGTLVCGHSVGQCEIDEDREYYCENDIAGLYGTWRPAVKCQYYRGDS